MKRFWAAFLCLGLWLTFLVPVQAEEAPENVRAVRIGLVDAADRRNDFAYELLLRYLQEYLDEVSKQNHWQYTYFRGTFDECRARLERGDLDFVAPVPYDPKDSDMAFTVGHACYSLLSLYQRSDDPIRAFRPEAMHGAMIGVLDQEAQRQALSYHLSRNNWPMTVRVFSSPEAMLAALHNREIDAVANDGSHITANERRALSFALLPAQLMTTADKADRCRKLTDAIQMIENFSPDFETELKADYLDRARQNLARHSEKERQFIEGSQALRVVFLPDVQPLFSVQGGLESSDGVYIDLLKMLATASGMRFELRQAPSEGALQTMLDEGEADLAFVVYTNGKSPMEMYYTSDFRQEEFSPVRRRDGNSAAGKGVAMLPASFLGAAHYWEKDGDWKIHTADTVEACLDEVANGTAEVAFVPTLYLRRENNLVLRSELTVIREEAVRVPVSMAISPLQPPLLQSVINTALLRLNREQMARLAQENSTPQLSLSYLLHQYPLQVAVLLCFVLVGGAITAFVLYRSKMERRQNQMLQQKNRQLEEALANVEAMRISRDGYKLDSETDKLTGTYNKAAFERVVREQLASLPEDKVAALFIVDMDHFKEANDTYGHQCGDDLLRKFATALRGVFRKSDDVGRFGGDEFLVFIVGLLTPEIIALKARQILNAARTVSPEGVDVHVTASIGIALVPEHGTGYDDIFRVADASLYKVKSEGRDGFSIASTEVIR